MCVPVAGAVLPVSIVALVVALLGLLDMVVGGWSQVGRQMPRTRGPGSPAGGPLTDVVLKCRLKPLDVRETDLVITHAQHLQHRAIFPDGVRDYSKPGIGQRPSIPSLTYPDGPGGAPLDEAPHSAAVVR